MSIKDRLQRLEAQRGKTDLLENIVFKVTGDGCECYREIDGQKIGVSEAELDHIEKEIKKKTVNIEVILPPGFNI